MTLANINARRSATAAALALLELSGNRSKQRLKRPSPTYTGTVTKRKRRAGQSDSMVKKIRGMETAQHNIVADSVLNQLMLHNDVYEHNITAGIPLGTANNARTNDEVFLEAIKFKLMLHDIAAQSNAVTFKLFLVMVDNFSATPGWTGGLASNFTFNNAVAFRVLNIPDPKKSTTLAEYTIEINPSQADAFQSQIVEDVVQLQKPFVYRTGTSEGKSRNLMWYITSSIIGGTSSVTQTGWNYLTYDLIFKNSK